MGEGKGTWLRRGREEDEGGGRVGGPEARLRGAIKGAKEEGKRGDSDRAGVFYWMLKNGMEPGRRCWDAAVEVIKIDGSARRVVTGIEEYV